MDLRNKIIVITGASSGLGRQLAIDLSKKGAKLALIGRDADRLNETLNLTNQDSSIYTCDVSDKSQVKKAAAKIIERYGFVDILINNAGFNIHGEFEKLSLEEIESIMAVNYSGIAYMMKEFLPSMLERHKGHVVNISSVAGLTGSPKSAAYAASKFAVVGLSESLYFELKDKGINISVVCPGAFKTNFFMGESFKNTIYQTGKRRMMPVKMVSNTVIDVIHSKKFLAVLPIDAKYRMQLKWLMPRTYRWLIDKVYRRILK